MPKKTLLALLIFLSGFNLKAQDTLRLMVYNLLFYGQFTSFCTPQNNHPNDKDAYLRTILAHDLPDIFVVNEMGISPYYHQRIIDSVLHKVTDKEFARAESQNIANSNIMNMLYYNTEKLQLHAQHIISVILRDIDLYTLYYKSPDLAYGDTVFIHCIAAHLKAGSSEGDQLTRLYEINNSIAWLKNNLPPGNILFMGDFNAKSVDEQAMQALFFGPDVDYRFYDPVNQLGTWINNPAFAMYHTQSTHTSGGNCHVGGGMDDRFDLIVASADIMQGNKKVSYIEGSYHTMGQDGLRLNKSLLDPPFNTSAPFEVIQALYHNSDHLPVLLSLAVDQSPASVRLPFATVVEFSYNNPVANQLTIHHNLLHGSHYSIDIYLTTGHLHSRIKGITGNQPVTVNMEHLPAGVYILEFKMREHSRIFKVVKI